VTLAASYADWVAATDTLLVGLSREAQAAILGGNAQRFYGLTPLPVGEAAARERGEP